MGQEFDLHALNVTHIARTSLVGSPCVQLGYGNASAPITNIPGSFPATSEQRRAHSCVFVCKGGGVFEIDDNFIFIA